MSRQYLTSLARFEQKNYYFRTVDPTHWNGVGAHPDYQPAPAAERITVADIDSLKQALSKAKPGQQIMVEPGTYTFDRTFELRQAGKCRRADPADWPAMHQVRFELKGEGLMLLAPHWHFENISFVGTCSMHDQCEHAIHIAGKASDVVIRNNSFRTDFNSA